MPPAAITGHSTAATICGTMRHFEKFVGSIGPSARVAIPTWRFAMVVVRLGRRFLVVHERKHERRWYLPAGRVEPGETIVAAAARETLEESGRRVVIEGVLRVELDDPSRPRRLAPRARRRDESQIP